MRRLECSYCHGSAQERLLGKLYRRRCLLCKAGILLEPEECYDEDGDPLAASTQRTFTAVVSRPVTRPTPLRCWACSHSVEELTPGALLGSVCNRCGEGRLLVCRD